MLTTKHAKCFASNKALFLNTRNNVSTGVPNKYFCLSAIDALTTYLKQGTGNGELGTGNGERGTGNAGIGQSQFIKVSKT